MDPNAATEFLQAAAAVSVCARLVYLGLQRQFSALLAYVSFIAVLNFSYGAMHRSSAVYFWTYFAIGPWENIFSILAVRELLSLMFQNYPGIRTVGRWAMYAGIVLSAGTSIAITRFFWHTGASGRHKWGLFYLDIAQRSIVFTLAVVIVAILFCLSKYPLHLGRNIYVTCSFVGALLLSETARLLIDGMTRALYTNFVDWTASVFFAFCLAGCAVMLQPETAKVTRVAFPTPHEDYLLHQLNSLNDLMVRAARR